MAISGLERTYDNSTVIREDLEQMISMISPEQTPLFSLLNRKPVYDTKHEWVEDTLRSITSQLNGDVTGSGGAVRIDVLSGHGAGRFPIATNYPMMMRIGEEILLGTARTTNYITVERGYASTATAAHSSGAIVEILGDMDIEGSDPRAAFAQSRTKVYNYTQVFKQAITTSRTMDKVAAAGIVSTEGDYQALQRLKEMKKSVERNLLFGHRVLGTGTGYQSMGGMFEYISTNVANAATAAITEANIQDDARACFEAGGQPNLLVAHPLQCQKITDLYGSRVRMEAESILGGLQIGRIILPVGGMGELAIVPDICCPNHEYYILTSSLIWLGVFDPFFSEDLAKTGDARKQQVVGEYTMIMKNESAHARRYGLAIT
jgi:hypothetical protein